MNLEDHGQSREMSLRDALKSLVTRPSAYVKGLQSAEARYIVTCDQTGTQCEKPDGSVSRVDWKRLTSVLIDTNDPRSRLPLYFWRLEGAGQFCVIPHGATGEVSLVERLGKLPGFAAEILRQVESCTESKTFECWRRPLGS
ncbi:MAG: hypothetical protein HYZ36_05720 [Pedosphaera parvula]|nr:hypothetical protein [Pedosphaera parvula]